MLKGLARDSVPRVPRKVAGDEGVREEPLEEGWRQRVCHVASAHGRLLTLLAPLVSEVKLENSWSGVRPGPHHLLPRKYKKGSSKEA